MVDIDPAYLIGKRNERWEFTLLDLEDQPVGKLDTVMGAKFDFSINNTIRSGGSLECAYDPTIDWLKRRIQPWYSILAEDDETILAQWPIGVFNPETPGEEYFDAGAEVSLELYDKLLLLDRDEIETTWVFESGMPGVEAVQQVIATVSTRPAIIEDQGKLLGGDMVFDVGTSKLRIINDLLAMMNYFSLWADGYGRFRGDAYTSPLSRPPSWVFSDSRDSIYSPNYKRNADFFTAPNKIVLIGQSEGDQEAPVAVAYNEDPDSPLSYQNRGAWITHTEQGVEADSPATLQAIADRRLIEKSQITTTFDLKTAHIPFDLNARVRFIDSEYGRESDCVVQGYSIDASLGALMELSLRQVIS